MEKPTQTGTIEAPGSYKPVTLDPITDDEVEVWLNDHRPGWWNYANPQSVYDPTFLAELKDYPPKNVTLAEVVKVALWAPNDSFLTAKDQRLDVVNAFHILFDDTKTADEARQFANSVFDCPNLPLIAKEDLLYDVLLGYCEDEQPRDLTWLKSREEWTALDLNRIQRAENFIYRMEPGDIYMRGFYALQDEWLDQFRFRTVRYTIDRLLELGDFEGAQSLCDKLNGQFSNKPEDLQKVQDQIDKAHNLYPAFEAMRQIVLQTIPDKSIQKPEGFDDRRHLMISESLNDLSEEESTQFRLYQMKINKVPLDLLFWYEFMRDNWSFPGSYDLNAKLIKTAMESGLPDDVKASFIDNLPWVIAVHDSTETAPIDKLLTSDINSQSLPQSAEALRLFETRIKLDQGKPVDINKDFSGYKDKVRIINAFNKKITLLLQRGDDEELRTALEQVPESDSPDFLESCLTAAEQLNMKHKADLFRTALKEQLHKYVLLVWEENKQNDIQYVRHAIEALGSDSDLPAEFSKFVDAQPVRRRVFWEYKIIKAFLDKDWKTCIDLAHDYNKKYPGYYDMDRPLAISLEELGQQKEAILALTLFCDHEFASVYLLRARLMLSVWQHSPV